MIKLGVKYVCNNGNYVIFHGRDVRNHYNGKAYNSSNDRFIGAGTWTKEGLLAYGNDNGWTFKPYKSDFSDCTKKSGPFKSLQLTAFTGKL